MFLSKSLYYYALSKHNNFSLICLNDLLFIIRSLYKALMNWKILKNWLTIKINLIKINIFLIFENLSDNFIYDYRHQF